MAAPTQDMGRALTAAGRKEIAEVVEALDRLDVDVTRIVTSPLRRAKETAAIAAKVLKKEDVLEVWEELKPESRTRELYTRLSKLRVDSTVLIVGHEPYLSGMIGELVAGSDQSRIVLKKAGIAKVEVTSLTPKPEGVLRWLLTPRLLKKIG